jgi:heat shock protein HslJ
MKHTTFVFSALVIMGAVIFAAGCISPESESLQGNWVLTGMGSDNASIIGDITLEITDTNISGNSGVNYYFGKITVGSEGKLNISGIGSTEMAGPADLMEQEQKYYAALANASAYKIIDGSLIISDNAGNTILTFKEIPPIVGKWLLASDNNVTVTFNLNGAFGGQAPVNVYGGSYTTSGNTLSIGEGIISTMMAGTEEQMKAEAAFFDALEKSAGYSIVNSQLVITDENGKELLIFVQA